MWLRFTGLPAAAFREAVSSKLAFIASKLDAPTTSRTTSSGAGTPRKAAILRTPATGSSLRSSYEIQRVLRLSSQAFHQPACQRQKQPDSTLPRRKRDGTKCSKSPVYSNAGTSLLWWYMETHASFGFRTTTITLASPGRSRPPDHGRISTGACVLKTRLLGAGAPAVAPSQASSWSLDLGSAFGMVLPFAWAETAHSSHGACTMGSGTLLRSPPKSRLRTICCIQVVPHLG
mmetsp:Transcript_13459/g.39307  ORF Transcript_13459/g.39307 Transcript_13459/m.39307 type:complete len:232 (+) Transcript_13459:244-939(+)